MLWEVVMPELTPPSEVDASVTGVLDDVAVPVGVSVIESEAVSVADSTAEVLVSSSSQASSSVEVLVAGSPLVVVEEDMDPPEGSVVVALLEDNEVTVKRLYRQNGSVRLKAESEAHQDIEVPWGEVQIQGKVVASIHSF